MKVELKLDKNMRIIGTNSLGKTTFFDTHTDSGGEDSAPTPMEIMLEAMGGCTFMDVLAILRKKRKIINELKISINGERAESHPKVFTKVHLTFELTSPDAEEKDLARAVELSQTTYCSAAAMFKRSGCEISYDLILHQN